MKPFGDACDAGVPTDTRSDGDRIVHLDRSSPSFICVVASGAAAVTQDDGMSGLDSFGGKGANLVRLREYGFPVPPFTVIPVREYHAFVAEHGLGEVIVQALSSGAESAPGVETQGGAAVASETIRAAFRRPLSADQRARLVAGIGDLAGQPVAVRSSATAEDLPDASFAGQQDTFLEVTGIDSILEKVIECWSSLWTERAITYRARNDIAVGADRAGLGLAVVVQQMVPAEASGVVFTADPLSGRRDRVVVDAVAGLGEKLVSGQVTPDHFEVEGPRIVERTVQGEQPALTDAQLLELAALSRRVAEHFGAPQDIEFTRVGDELQLVQSRPITSLFPVPEGDREAIYFSFGAFQGMLAPVTPLGRDALEHVEVGLFRLFGVETVAGANPYVRFAGERFWVRLDRVLVGPWRSFVLRFLPMAEPVSAAILAHLATEPAYAPAGTGPGRIRAVKSAAPILGYLAPRIARNFADPDAARVRFGAAMEREVEAVAGELEGAAVIADPARRLQARIRVAQVALEHMFSVLLPQFGPIMGPSILMMRRLRALAAQTGLPDADALALTVMRSLPDNVTTEMDLALNAAARRIAADPASVEAIAADPAEVAKDYLAGALPQVAAAALDDFLGRYGMRGVAEIDLGAPRWRERPEQVIRTIQTYLTDTDHALSYEEGRRSAEKAIETLAEALPKHKAAQVRFLGSRLRGLFGLRETPKFTIVRVLGLIREALLASGRDLVEAGRLDDPDDVVLLGFTELSSAFATDHRRVIAERRVVREREARRTRVPSVLVGDGRTFYSAPASPGGDSGAEGVLSGSGVSPGIVTAVVRIVDDPATAELQPGEIMVCRGTDPAWTPLFLTAGGLVTEVGGLMTHGSVVAREYGLPAVVGIPDATRLLATGDVITLDGSAGTITREANAPST